MAAAGSMPWLVEAAEQIQRFADREFFGQLGLLQRDADALLDGLVVAAPLHAQDFDFAAGGREQPFEDLDRGGLAGAVGAEQAEAFALLDGQIEPAHGVDRRPAIVAFAQIIGSGWQAAYRDCGLRVRAMAG